jgi:methylthioribulose-1-phosphate dehydratase
MDVMCSTADSFVQPASPESSAIDAVVAASRHFGALGWTPATAGNFSVRTGDSIAITRSGCDKRHLCNADVALIPLHQPALDGLSAEAPLHLARYRADPSIGAVFHVHAPYSAVLGRRHVAAGTITLTGWELQKALSGQVSHEGSVILPILDNHQDMQVLVPAIDARLRRADASRTAPGFLLAGHGLYAWGRTAADARRHVEALEGLLTLHALEEQLSP